MAIKITRPGIFTTIQDLGRYGYRSVGIGPGGAMDFFAASVSNFLVGNDAAYPVIEMHFPSPEMLFAEDVLVSIAGGNFSVQVNDEPVAAWKPLLLKKGSSLSFKKYIDGARTYLAIRGGIAADSWLNSFSSHIGVKAGGYKGRPLKKDDIINLTATDPFMRIENFPDTMSMIRQVYQPANIIRCITGPDWNLLQPASGNVFKGSTFLVTGESNRMGYRLQGTGLILEAPVQLVSSPVDYGTIQLLPNGQLVALMADHQTTGGYPAIASVIHADLPKLAQLNIHSKLQFEIVDIESAEEALFSLYQTLDSIKAICRKYYDANRSQL